MRVYYSDFINKLQSGMLETRDQYYVNVYSRFDITKPLGSDSSIVAGIYGGWCEMWLKIDQLIDAMYAERYKLFTSRRIRLPFNRPSLKDFADPQVVAAVYCEIGHRWP